MPTTRHPLALHTAPQVIRGLAACAASALFALLASCASTAYGPGQAPVTRYIATGDTVVLNEALEVGSGERAWLQHGESMSSRNVYQRKPYCYFHVYRDPSVVDTPFSVAPDRFRVSAVSVGVEYSALPPRELLAFLGEYTTYITQDASAQNIMVRMALTSETQPAVRWLKCGIFAVPNERGYLSQDEIHEVLGDLVSFEPGYR